MSKTHAHRNLIVKWLNSPDDFVWRELINGEFKPCSIVTALKDSEGRSVFVLKALPIGAILTHSPLSEIVYIARPDLPELYEACYIKQELSPSVRDKGIAFYRKTEAINKSKDMLNAAS